MRLALRSTLDQHWRDQALCRDVDPDTFFGSHDTAMSQKEIRRAKAVCLYCPVRVECLEYALTRREGFGVWGGLSSGQRRRLLLQAGGNAVRALSGYLSGRLPS